MRRSFLAVPVLLSFTVLWLADEPAKPKPAVESSSAIDANLSDAQLRLAKQYQELERMLLKIAQKMDRSSNPDDRARAKLIHKAVQEARERKISGNLEHLSTLLKNPALDNLKKAVEDGTAVKADLEHILAILLSEDSKAYQEYLKQLIAMLNAAIHKQSVAKARNQNPDVAKEDAEKAQKLATEEVKRILEKIDQRDKEKQSKDDKAKDKAADKAKGQDGKDSKDANGKDGKDGKDGKGKPKDGEPMPQDGDSPSQGDQDDEGQQQEKTPGRKKIKDANDDQHDAEKDINKGDRNKAADKQEEAKKKLEEARKKLEEILRQMREEEIERLLAALRERCEKMLRMQEAVYNATKSLDQRIQSMAARKPGREEEQDSRVLADKEDEIVQEANFAIKLLETEGTAVAFPEVFEQVRNDMTHVSKRLGRTDTGVETQAIEEDIIATLKEMIEALKKAQQDQQNRRNQGPQGPPPPQGLIDLIAELKMIRSMQVRVNKRTTLWGQRYPGEQAEVSEIIAELKDLAKRQLRIYEVTNNIAKGKNQ